MVLHILGGAGASETNQSMQDWTNNGNPTPRQVCELQPVTLSFRAQVQAGGSQPDPAGGPGHSPRCDTRHSFLGGRVTRSTDLSIRQAWVKSTLGFVLQDPDEGLCQGVE